MRNVLTLGVTMAALLLTTAPPAYALPSSRASSDSATILVDPTYEMSQVSYGKNSETSVLAARHLARFLDHEIVTVTPKPTVTPTKTPPRQPALTPTAESWSLNANLLFDMSNTHRATLGLAPFVKDERLCALASERAPEVNAEVAGGFMHQGLHDRNIPFWITENIITMATEQSAFDWWLGDYIHRLAIESDNTHSCVSCSGTACAQEFTSWSAK